MKNRMKAVPQRVVRTIDTWRLGKAEIGSRIPDDLLSRFRGALMATASQAMGETIFFRQGSSDLDARARASLRDRSTVLRANSGIRVVIGGLASRPGSMADGVGLGLQRVLAIRGFLLSQDIDPTRIEVAIRGAGWFLVERPGRATEEDPSGECRIQIADPQWALWRN